MTETIENHPRPLTREERWTDHANELRYLNVDVTTRVALKANEKFNAVYARQRVDAKAQQLHPDADYRDMISDELHLDPTRTNDEIAHLVATRYAHP